MMVKAKEKFISYMNIKTACFLIAYIQLMLHLSITATVAFVLLTLAKAEPVKDVESMGRVINTLLVGQLVFPVALIITKFTIVLIVGLHTKNRVRIQSYIIFATLALILTAMAVIILNYTLNMQIPRDVLLTTTIPYAISIYLLRRYLNQQDPVDLKPFKETV